MYKLKIYQKQLRRLLLRQLYLLLGLLGLVPSQLPFATRTSHLASVGQLGVCMCGLHNPSQKPKHNLILAIEALRK